jgi:hypothetical protein
VEFWLDILAVIPQFRAFRGFRAMRLLRLFRILRFFGVATRIANHFPSIFRRGTTEYLVMCGLLVVTVIFSTVLMVSFEKATLDSAVPADKQFTFEKCSLVQRLLPFRRRAHTHDANDPFRADCRCICHVYGADNFRNVYRYRFGIHGGDFSRGKKQL